MSDTATGAHQRVRMRRTGQGVMLHGTVQAYNYENGEMTVLFDVDKPGTPVLTFTVEASARNRYQDQLGRQWEIIN